MGYGQFVDQEVLDGGFGMQFLPEGSHQELKALRRFAAEDNSAGEHALVDIAAQGSAFSIGGGGAAGPGSVNASGGNFLFG
jgi:hypothetical protein